MKRTAIALVFVAALGGSVLATWLQQSAMAARSSSGTMSLATGNPVVTRTAISSAVFNNTMTDIASELTDSLSRSGKGGMSAPLLLTTGSVSAPSVAFSSETNTGFYRVGSHDLGVTVNGVKLADWLTTGLTVSGALISTNLTVNNALTTSMPIGQFLAAGLLDANYASLVVGRSAAANSASVLSFLPNATAANSTACLDVYGQSSTLCVDGSAKVHVGSGGSALGKVLYAAGTCTFGTVGANVCSGSCTVTVTGALTTGACSVSHAADAEYGALSVSCTVSAADTVKVKACNPQASGQSTTNATPVYVSVIQP